MNSNAHQIDGQLEEPQCARCGYDLTGEVGSWKESCPVAGVCSECGLEFLWADALRADRQRLRWLYEHAEHWWDVRRAWGTAVRALVPWQFWRTVQPCHEVSVKRLITWLGLVCVSIGGAGAAFMWATSLLATYTSSLSFSFSGHDALHTAAEMGIFVSGYLSLVLVFNCGIVLAGFALSRSPNGSRPKLSTIARLGVYSCTAGLVWLLVMIVLYYWGHMSYELHSAGAPTWWCMSPWFWINPGFAVSTFFLAPIWSVLSWGFGLRRGMHLSVGRTIGATAISLVVGIVGLYAVGFALADHALGFIAAFVIILIAVAGVIYWRRRTPRMAGENTK